jgi:O-antigen/teichoic acid export membrane protein
MLLAPVMLFVFLTGGWLLGLFGQDYADKGTGLLLILTASAVPDAITNLYVAVLRVQRRLRAAATLALGMATIAVAGGWALAPQHGLVGVGVAWLVSQSVGSLWVARDAWAQRQSLHLPQTVA